MDLLDMLTEAVLDTTLTPDEGPHTHGLAHQADRTEKERDGRIICTYLCRCGQTFVNDHWDLHLSSTQDPRPEPDTVNGTTNALGEHARQLWGELAQRMSACRECGHAKILHGKVNNRAPSDHAGKNGDCTHCSCRTFRRHKDLGRLHNTRMIAHRNRTERAQP